MSWSTTRISWSAESSSSTLRIARSARSSRRYVQMITLMNGAAGSRRASVAITVQVAPGAVRLDHRLPPGAEARGGPGTECPGGQDEPGQRMHPHPSAAVHRRMEELVGSLVLAVPQRGQR